MFIIKCFISIFKRFGFGQDGSFCVFFDDFLMMNNSCFFAVSSFLFTFMD